MQSPPTAAPPARVLRDARGNVYQPAVGPRLQAVLFLLFTAMAVLGTTGVYLVAVRLLERLRGRTYTNQFTLWMFLVHVLAGVAVALPFVAFGVLHWRAARTRKNRLAVRLGLALFWVGVLVVVSGLALIQLSGLPQLPTGSVARWVTYGLHVAFPVAMVVLYVLHRRAGPDIRWGWGLAWGVAVSAALAVLVPMHLQDPRKWYAQGPREGEKYFEPSRARTADGNFIPAAALMMDHYCVRCHKDTVQDWFHSAHHFSSFNNPPYRFSVRETRKVGLERDGSTRASRWCAGCHDAVPFFSGAFDDPNFDDVNHPTAQAGINCTVCHAITHVNSATGNADYTIEEPQHYPFAYSTNPVLQWLNNQVVKAKPDFHKKTFLKPFHRTAEFCSTCHKVSLPVELNHYKEFLRGQNHYDSYLLSGVSGHGARSFYYPPKAKENCAACHMPLHPSDDFGSRNFDGSGTRKVHGHLFPAANTGLPALLAREPQHADRVFGFLQAAQRHADFLRGTAGDGSDRKLRIDLFGLKEGGTIDGPLAAPLRPNLPALQPGKTYLVEVVIRTLGLGHPFTQGTVDSNEVWVDFTARSGDRVLGRSGALANADDNGPLDEWAHRVNVLMLDRNGNRVNRRNPQDIFTPLYDHQIPPGAAQVVHYALRVPADVAAPVELAVKLRYRKFDFEYLSLVYGGADRVPKLPVVDLCEDRVTLPVAGVAADVDAQTSPIDPPWQRWNDYGIGCFLEGGAGAKRGELRQAEEAFRTMLKIKAPAAWGHAHLNLARVMIEEGRLAEAVEELNAAARGKMPAPWWTVAWFNGLVNAENARDAADFDAAIAAFERVLDPDKQPRDRGFDFTKDYVVLDRLAVTLFKRAQLEAEPAAREPFLRRAVEQYRRALALDGEDLDAHFGLSQAYARLAAGQPAAPAPAEAPATDEDHLAAQALTLRNGQEDKAHRLEAAAGLARAVTALGREPVTAEQQKRPRLERLVAQLGPLWEQEPDAETRAALASALAALHRELHAIFRPDDIARARTVSQYRREHPAANAAAEAIVIYPLNRAGAPGL